MSDAADSSGTPQRVKCPACSELILPGARICKSCKEILDPKLKNERSPATAPLTPEQAAHARKVGWVLAFSIIGTLLIGWGAGILLGPLFLWVSRRLSRTADRLGMMKPGGVSGIFACGILCLVIGTIVGSAIAIPVVVLAFRPADVYVDNGLQQEVVFVADGERQGTVAAGLHQKFSVRKGGRKLLVRGGDGTLLHEGLHDLTGGGKYILNPSAPNSYLVRTQEYTTGPTIRYGWSPPAPVPLKGEPFMDVSAYDFILEPLPSAVSMSAGQSSTQRRAVERSNWTPAPVPELPPPVPVTPEAPAPPRQETPAPPPPTAKIERRVRLEVSADSWRDGGPYKVEKDLKEKLAAAGVGVLPGKAKKSDGTLKVSWSENKGKEYKALGSDTKSGDGTSIDLSIEVLDAEGNELLKIEASGETPEFINGSDFFGTALEQLRSHACYKFLGECVGASLGLKSLLPKLLPALTWDDSAEVAKKLLEDYKPRTPEEAAWIALGEDDYDACAKLGAAALDPLIEVFDRRSTAPAGGLDEKHLAAIVAIGGPKARQTVLSQLGMKKDNVEIAPDDVVLLIHAAETLEERGAVPILEQLAKGDQEEVAAAAKKALRRLRRVEAPTGKPLPPPPEKSGDAQADRFNDRGLERLAAGKWNAAAASFTQAIDLVPRHGPYYWNRARSQWNARAWRAALPDLEKAAELVPAREDDARLRIFILRCRLGDRDKAAAELKSYAAERGGWLSNTAGALLGDLSAKELLDKARQQGDPATTAQANFYAGMALALQGNSKAAAPYLRACADAPAGAAAEAEAARVELEGLDR